MRSIEDEKLEGRVMLLLTNMLNFIQHFNNLCLYLRPKKKEAM